MKKIPNTISIGIIKKLARVKLKFKNMIAWQLAHRGRI
jgi:hypothetical protein